MSRIIMLLVVIIIIASLINWVRAGQGWPIVHVLPFLGGDRPSLLYDGGAIVLLGLGAAGLAWLRRGDE